MEHFRDASYNAVLGCKIIFPYCLSREYIAMLFRNIVNAMHM